MPTYTEMRSILQDRMKDHLGAPLKSDLNGRQIAVEEDPFFKDWANIGAFLSEPAWRPKLRTALQELENDMLARIGGLWLFSDRKNSAVSHFGRQAAAYQQNKPPPPSDPNFGKLLTRALDDFERKHGFVVPEKLPVFVAFVFGGVFKDTIKSRMHFKDVGAGPNHGEFTHRIQWYALTRGGALISVDKENAGDVYSAIHRWLNKNPGGGGQLLQLWNYVFDMQPRLVGPGDRLDGTDFRSPENLNLWLTGDEEPDFCPLLRSFLRARMNKRQRVVGVDQYFKKKLGAQEGQKAYDAWLLATSSNQRPSARIVYDGGKVGRYAPTVG